MPSEAQVRAQTKWEAKKYDKVLLRILKDEEPTRQTMTEVAQDQGKSLNQFILDAVKNEIDRISGERQECDSFEDEKHISPEIEREKWVDPA